MFRLVGRFALLLGALLPLCRAYATGENAYRRPAGSIQFLHNATLYTLGWSPVVQRSDAQPSVTWGVVSAHGTGTGDVTVRAFYRSRAESTGGHAQALAGFDARSTGVTAEVLALGLGRADGDTQATASASLAHAETKSGGHAKANALLLAQACGKTAESAALLVGRSLGKLGARALGLSAEVSLDGGVWQRAWLYASLGD